MDVTGLIGPGDQEQTISEELEDWTTSVQPNTVRKITVSTSRLFLLSVEYSDPTLDYGAGAPFSPQPSISLSELEQIDRVSPLDPNLSSAARYSPVCGTLNGITENQIQPVADNYNTIQPIEIHQYAESSDDLKQCDSNVAFTLEPPVLFPTTSESEELNIVSLGLDSVNLEPMKNPVCHMDSLFDTQPPEATEFSQLAKSQMQQELNCSDCTCDNIGSNCNVHRVQTISDKPVPLRSWATLPASYLAISKLATGSNEYGVYARKTIPSRTQFGPIEGILTLGLVDSEKLKLLVEDDTGTMQRLDMADDNCSNWMKFVRCAMNLKDQNLILSQQGHSLYFTSTKLIYPRQELLVWYSLPYASKRGLPILLPTGLETLEPIASWPCFQCSAEFTLPTDLQKHLAVHNNKQVPKKKKLRKSVSGRALQRAKLPPHLTNKKFGSTRSEKVVYQCNTCQSSFAQSRNLKRHQLSHRSEGNGVEYLYGQSFTLLANHKFNSMSQKSIKGKDSTRQVQQGWMCPECNLVFESSSILKLHTLVHGEFSTTLKSKSDTTNNNNHLESSVTDTMVLHALDQGGEMLDGQCMQCPECCTAFPTREQLINHIESHALCKKSRGSVNSAKPCKCELCYKAFASEERLQQHMLVHGTDDSKPLQCEICTKRFLNNSALACHVKIHADKKVFECPICKLIFDHVLTLKDHVTSHASDEGIYSCPQCPKTFDEYTTIRKHIRSFHSDRKHDCSYCFKLFPTLDKLRMHMLRHSDHREFLCANCGKQFKRKDKLKEHMKRMHSIEREQRLATKQPRSTSSKKCLPKVQISPTDYHRFIYKCHTCILGFKRRGMLVNHLAKRHPDIRVESVPELNLPILKTTRDYYCQYCDKVYKSSSKRKAHILKNHPGAELPMSNRRKGGVPDIPGLPNPTFSQTVGSITTCPHGCSWCHKQYASKAKLLQHQRKKHLNLLPNERQVLHPPEETVFKKEPHGINIITNDFQLQLSPDDFDTTPLKRSSSEMRLLGDSDLLTQAMCELSHSLGEFRVSAEQYQQLLASAEVFAPYTAR